jgi:hypothetical protein
MGQAKPAANEKTILKGTPNLRGSGIGANIKVFGFQPQQQIADSPTHKIGSKPLPPQTIQDLEGIRVNIFARNRMLGPGNNL